MKTFTASEAKNQFGTIIDAAQQKPITITKHGRPFAIFLSVQTYEALQEAFWMLQAKKDVE